MTIYNRDINNIKFSKVANDDFLLTNVEQLLKEEVLLSLINKHKTEQLPRLIMLEDYYLNRNTDILTDKRRVTDLSDKSDHRAVHNYAKYVTRFIVGYLTGNPISITHKDEKTNEAIANLNVTNDADATNSDLALNLSIYGRAYEIVYRDKNDVDKFKVLDSKNTFVVYDNTLEKKIIAGIRYYIVKDNDNLPVQKIEVYTVDRIFYITTKSGKFLAIDSIKHYYNDVPIIEYLNDQFKQGDFENVISLIDLYDSAQSDTANYMTDINDAMLAIVGNVEIDGDDAHKFRQANMVHIKPNINSNGSDSNAEVKYIYKQYDVNGAEAYKTRLQRDIHKYTNTPDLTDENFSGVQSGESMKYKLFGLEQVRSIKERLFKKGLMGRYKILFNNLNLTSVYNYDYTKIEITFTPNLPKSLSEFIEAFNALNGGVSEQTRLKLLPIIENPNDEIKKMDNERKKLREESDHSSFELPITHIKEMTDSYDR
ncbi:phage portal protein [Staphylococcus haemolyticus]|uniref:phage portal protein n=1 Tax=Staphylococcus haemolyticus TaxID=1283 RepID=UPI001F3FEDBA|nr:phage portal protein [Staphylococcus haemolyticus]MCE4992076.1 phage portal protein [Staphylococcus haemolyticus]